MATKAKMHTQHPCSADGCRSEQQYVLTNPDHTGTIHYDGLHPDSLRDPRPYFVSRTFGAASFGTRQEAEVAAARLPFVVDVTPWGTLHRRVGVVA